MQEDASRKIFIHGGSDTDRDKCVNYLVGKHNAYFMIPEHNKMHAIVDSYFKYNGEKSVVVMKYQGSGSRVDKMAKKAESRVDKTAMEAESRVDKLAKEAESRADNMAKEAESRADRMAQEAYDLAGCLRLGIDSTPKNGPIVFTRPTHVFVLSKFPPKSYKEWESGEGWTFCEVLDGKVCKEAINVDDIGPFVGAAPAFVDAGPDLGAVSAQGHPAAPVHAVSGSGTSISDDTIGNSTPLDLDSPGFYWGDQQKGSRERKMKRKGRGGRASRRDPQGESVRVVSLGKRQWCQLMCSRIGRRGEMRDSRGHWP